MNISDCINQEKQFQSTTRPLDTRTLTATTLEEVELLDSVAKLLYKTKSVRKAITIIDSLANSEYCIKHEIDSNLDSIVWNNTILKDKQILDRNSKHESIPYSGC